MCPSHHLSLYLCYSAKSEDHHCGLAATNRCLLRSEPGFNHRSGQFTSCRNRPLICIAISEFYTHTHTHTHIGRREISAILLTVVGDCSKDLYIYNFIYNMGSKLDSFLRKGISFSLLLTSY